MLNKVILIGRLGKDPEIKSLPDGTTVSNFSMACGRDYKAKSGEMKNGTEWINCVAFGKTADLVGNYLQKGSKAYCEGKLRTRSWESNDGTKKYATEVVLENVIFLDGRSGAETPQSQGSLPFPGQGQMTEDDVPF